MSLGLFMQFVASYYYPDRTKPSHIIHTKDGSYEFVFLHTPENNFTISAKNFRNSQYDIKNKTQLAALYSFRFFAKATWPGYIYK